MKTHIARRAIGRVQLKLHRHTFAAFSTLLLPPPIRSNIAEKAGLHFLARSTGANINVGKN